MVRLVDGSSREGAEKRTAVRDAALPPHLEPARNERDGAGVYPDDAAFAALPSLHHERPELGSKSFTASASAELASFLRIEERELEAGGRNRSH